MKGITLKFLGLLTLLTISRATNAQCTPPDLSFVSPLLVAGTALSEGAVYKFLNVSPGVDCFITLVKFNGGASLVSMETPGQGYGDAWQPIIDGPGAPLNNKSWIDWRVSFKTTAGTNYSFPCLAICGIDIDGDNGYIGEFIESDGQASYDLAFPSFLTVTDKGDGRIEAQGPTANRAGIDTFSLDVRINYLFTGLDSIQLKIGQTVLGPGTGGATQRLNSIYFKKVTLAPFVILPVKQLPIVTTLDQNKVDINWQTDNETDNSYFEVERSFNGNDFNKIAVVSNVLSSHNSSRRYGISDNIVELGGKEVVYYRVKQVQVNGKFIYSPVATVHLITNKAVLLQIAPNPVQKNFIINFSCAQQAVSDFIIRKVTGETVLRKKAFVKKGYNSIQIEDLSGLSSGMYIIQMLINGAVAGNQKILKD